MANKRPVCTQCREEIPVGQVATTPCGEKVHKGLCKDDHIRDCMQYECVEHGYRS